MERFFNDPKTIAKLRTGPLGLNIQQLADELFRQGYTRLSIRVRIQALARFGCWLKKCSIPLQDLTLAHTASYLNRYGTVKNGDGKILRMLLELLSRNGLLHQPIQLPPDDSGTTSIVGKFLDYLRQQRGLASGTIKHHRTYVAMFLGFRFPDGPVDLSKIEAKDLAAFMQKEAARRTPMSAKNVSTILRSFAAYLFVVGMIDRDISGSVPTVRCWSLSGIPKTLTRKQVNRVLAGCNRQTATGRRDFAVLLLLVHLGLRAGEVAALRLEDIDWTAGTLIVSGKGAKECKLPLPRDVGQAIAAYLCKDRPSAPSKRVFVRISAPHLGFEDGRSVCMIVNRAVARVDMEFRSKGAHQFRHTLAARMLANGASLLEIGSVLRHENPKTTFIYTKVDFKALRPIAKPWPGGAR
jgi:site-specific recombinase XerD